MSLFIKTGNIFRVNSDSAIDVHYTLPPTNYIVKVDQYSAFYLEQCPAFIPTSKRYGDTDARANKILKTFEDRPSTTGVLLAGEKGSGKTLLAKMISHFGAERGYPTILINAPLVGDAFNKFLQDIDQPTIIIFDEFEKVYSYDDQKFILTLLDGVFQTKKLFLLTCNDKYKVDHHMRNRPGRIFYLLDFDGLSAEFIAEYCTDNLIDKTHTESVCKMACLFPDFNFDMLKALVEEMNRFGESPHDAMVMLNVKPEFSKHYKYNIELEVNGHQIQTSALSYSTWGGNPLADEVEIEYRGEDPEDTDDDHSVPSSSWTTITFNSSDITAVNQGNQIIFQTPKARLVLTKNLPTPFDYRAF